MSKQFFKVEGLSDLEDALAELPKATARNVLLRTLKAAAVPIQQTAQNDAPRRTGGLIKSIVISTKLSRRQRAASKKESPVEIYVGPSPHPKGVQQEFGNARHGAHAFMRPAWDANVMTVLATIKSLLSSEIDKAVARIARKAAREAAKMGKL